MDKCIIMAAITSLDDTTSDVANIVTFNVGGNIHSTSRSTVERIPLDSFFYKLLNSGIPSTRDINGHYFIDRDGKHFRHVLNFLRDGVSSLYNIADNETVCKQLLTEVKYYMLDEMEKSLLSIMSKKEKNVCTAVFRGQHSSELLQEMVVQGWNIQTHSEFTVDMDTWSNYEKWIVTRSGKAGDDAKTIFWSTELTKLITRTLGQRYSNELIFLGNILPNFEFITADKGHAMVSIGAHHGLKQLNDSGQEVKTFLFYTSLPGINFHVIAEVSLQPTSTGGTQLSLFFHRDRGEDGYIPSEDLRLRQMQLKSQLEEKKSQLEMRKQQYKFDYENGKLDLATLIAREKEIIIDEERYEEEEITQEGDAKIADLAGMPTSSFSTMDEAARKYFDLVQRVLTASRATR